MGRRGPAPEPTALKLLKGNPGRCPLNEREPTPAAGVPAIPPGLVLDEVAQRQWDELSRILSNMRILTEADGLVLAALCQIYSRWVEASKQLQQGGLTVQVGKIGRQQQNPLVGIVNTCISQMSAMGRELGLSPSSRTNIQTVEPPKTPNKFSQLGLPVNRPTGGAA